MTTPEIVDHIHNLILVDRRIAAERIAEIREISRKCIRFIIHESLDMQKLSANWVPKSMNADDKR